MPHPASPDYFRRMEQVKDRALAEPQVLVAFSDMHGPREDSIYHWSAGICGCFVCQRTIQRGEKYTNLRGTRRNYCADCAKISGPDDVAAVRRLAEDAKIEREEG